MAVLPIIIQFIIKFKPSNN